MLLKGNGSLTMVVHFCSVSAACAGLQSVDGLESFDQILGNIYHPGQGSPGISTRLMVALR